MRVILNGAERDLPDTATVAAAVAAAGIAGDERGVAVAIDAAVIPRSEWAVTAIREGARIEVLRASAGG